MTQPSETPSETTIREELQAAEEMWAACHEKKKKLRAFYRKEYPVPHIKIDNVLITPLEYRSGRYSDAIDRTTGLLRVDVRYSIDAKALAPRGLAHAEETERWLNALPRLVEFSKVDHAVVSEVVNLGYSFRVVLPDPQKWADYPEFEAGASVEDYNKALRKYGELAPPPIMEYHIPALEAYPLLHGDSVYKMYHKVEVRAFQITMQYPDIKLPKDTKDTDKFEHVTLIDGEWVCYLVSPGGGGSYEYAKAPWRHHMPLPKGKAPVALYEGVLTGDGDLAYRWKGFMEDHTDPIVLQDMISSQQGTLAAVTAVPTFTLEVLPGSIATAEQINLWNKEHAFVLGGINFAPPGTRWAQVAIQTQNPVQEYVYGKQENVLDARDQPALRGNIPGGSGLAGYTLNQMTEFALATRKPIAENMAQGDEESARLRFATLGALSKMAGGQDVPVAVRSRKDNAVEAIYRTWSDVKDYGGLVRATRESQMPQDELANLQAVQQAIDVGLPLADSLERYGHRENPAELMEQRKAEDIMKEEPFATQERERIAKQLGLIRDEEEGITGEELAAMDPQTPALRAILQQQGFLPPEGDPYGGTDFAALMQEPPRPGGPMPQTPPPGPVSSPVPAANGAAVRRPRNPRAGQKQRPGGPRRKTGSVQIRS